VHANRGNFEAARRQVRAAAALVSALPPEAVEAAALEVDVAQALVDAATGDTPAVRERLLRVVPKLRRLAGERPLPATLEALALALILRAERSRDAGALPDAVASGREATEVLREAPGARALLGVRSRYQEAAARCLMTSGRAEAMRDLAELSVEAARGGLVCESTLISGELAALHRVRGAPQRALDVALPVLPTLRDTCGGVNAALILFDVAAAYGALDRFDEAVALTTEARALASTSYARAVGDLRLAEIELRRRHFRDAAEAAATARDGFLALGNSRLAATALRVLAEVFEAQGDARTATRAINETLDLLREGAFPYAQALALRTAARITHDRRYLIASRDLTL